MFREYATRRMRGATQTTTIITGKGQPGSSVEAKKLAFITWALMWAGRASSATDYTLHRRR